MSSGRTQPGSRHAEAYELVPVPDGQPATHSLDIDERPGRVHRRRRRSQSRGEHGTNHIEAVGLLSRARFNPIIAIRSSSLRTALELVTQSTPSLLCAIVGSVMTGFVFDQVQFWPAFVRVQELFILVPVLLNLKGCLEMNLASRLSTSVQSTVFLFPSDIRQILASWISVKRVAQLSSETLLSCKSR